MGASAGSNLGQMGDTDYLAVLLAHLLHDIRHAVGYLAGDSGIYFVDTMVGSLTAPAIIALMESMTRAISPPEATEETLCNAPFLFAENKKFTVSAPCMPGSLRAPISTWKRTLGMPNGTSRAAICFSTSRATAVRAW